MTMNKLIEGVRRFRTEDYPRRREFFEDIASRQQRPRALFICCSDSRVNINEVTQAEPGELFIIRNAGNIVPPYGTNTAEGATIEYAVAVLGIENIIICGHSQCGAMGAILRSEQLNDLPAAKAWFGHCESTRRIVQRKYHDLPQHELVRRAAEENVLVQMNNLTTHPVIAARLATDELNIYGWYYDIGSGCVSQFDQRAGDFVELNDSVPPTTAMPTTSNGRMQVNYMQQHDVAPGKVG